MKKVLTSPKSGSMEIRKNSRWNGGVLRSRTGGLSLSTEKTHKCRPANLASITIYQMDKRWYNNLWKRAIDGHRPTLPARKRRAVTFNLGEYAPQNTNAPHGYPPCGATFLPFLTLKTIKSVLFDSKPVARKTSLKVLTTGKNASIFRQIDGRVLHFCEYSAIMTYNDSMYQKSQFLYMLM